MIRENINVVLFRWTKSLSRWKRSLAEIIDIFQDGGDEGLSDGLAFFAGGERGVTPGSGGRIDPFSLRIASWAARLLGIETPDGFFHARVFGLGGEEQRNFDFAGGRAAG